MSRKTSHAAISQPQRLVRCFGSCHWTGGYSSNVNTALDVSGVEGNGPAFMRNLPSARAGLWLLIGLLESLDVEFVHLKQCLHHSLRFFGVLVLQHLV